MIEDLRLERTLATVEQAIDVLGAHGIDALVIGGIALAVHNFPRDTEDVDLAVAAAPRMLSRIADDLRELGYDVELRRPDADDPLGGVIDVRAPDADLVQIINFDNSPGGGFPRLVHDALPRAVPIGSSKLRAADLFATIAFKLYAGGPKSKLDVLELLERNDVDLDALRARCASLGLGAELEQVLALQTRA